MATAAATAAAIATLRSFLFSRSARAVSRSAAAFALSACSARIRSLRWSRAVVTNGASTCTFEWEEGKQSTGIELGITQDGEKVQATLGGVTGALFTLVFGSALFDGTVQGSALELTNYGERTAQQGNCSFTYNAVVEAEQMGDSIEGTLDYTAKTNGNPDCAQVECSAQQRFSGSRPPR